MHLIGHHPGDDRLPLTDDERADVMLTAEWARQNALSNVYSAPSQRALFIAKAIARAQRMCVCRIKVTTELDFDKEKFPQWLAAHTEETGIAVTHPHNLGPEGLVD